MECLYTEKKMTEWTKFELAHAHESALLTIAEITKDREVLESGDLDDLKDAVRIIKDCLVCLAMLKSDDSEVASRAMYGHMTSNAVMKTA